MRDSLFKSWLLGVLFIDGFRREIEMFYDDFSISIPKERDNIRGFV